MDPIIFSQGLSTTREGERLRAQRELERLRVARERTVAPAPQRRTRRGLAAILRPRHA